MRTVPLVLLAAMLVLSGCAGPFGGSSGSGSPTPAAGDVPDVPGVSDGELTNVSALLSAHVSGMTETGYETNVVVNATELLRGERYDARRRQQTLVEPSADEYVYRLTDFAAGARFDTWGNDSVSVTRARFQNTTRYQRGSAASPQALTGVRLVQPFLRATEFEVTSVGRESNRTLVTLTSTGSPGDDLSVVPRNATDVRNYRARLVVDTTGRILSFEATADYTIGGDEGSMRIVHDVLRTDRPRVERPEWAEEALSEA
jgi:hypothetical protein